MQTLAVICWGVAMGNRGAGRRTTRAVTGSPRTREVPAELALRLTRYGQLELG